MPAGMVRAREYRGEERDVSAGELQNGTNHERGRVPGHTEPWGRAGAEESTTREGRAGSERHSDIRDILPHCLLELPETLWTVGVSEREIGRI
jgi:hypothetical protein